MTFLRAVWRLVTRANYVGSKGLRTQPKRVLWRKNMIDIWKRSIRLFHGVRIPFAADKNYFWRGVFLSFVGRKRDGRQDGLFAGVNFSSMELEAFSGNSERNREARSENHGTPSRGRMWKRANESKCDKNESSYIWRKQIDEIGEQKPVIQPKRSCSPCRKWKAQRSTLAPASLLATLNSKPGSRSNQPYTERFSVTVWDKEPGEIFGNEMNISSDRKTDDVLSFRSFNCDRRETWETDESGIRI